MSIALSRDRGCVTSGRSIVTAGIACAVAAVLSFAVLAVVLLSAAVSMRRYGFSLRDRAEAPLVGAAFLGIASLALGVAVVLLLRRRQVGRLSTVLVSASLLPVIAVMLWIIWSELDSRSAGAWGTPKALLGFGANAVALLGLVGGAVLLSLPVTGQTWMARARRPDRFVVAPLVPVVVATLAGLGALGTAIWADALLRDARLTPEQIGELFRLAAIVTVPGVLCVAGLQLAATRRRLGGILAGVAGVALMLALWCVTVVACLPLAGSMDAPWSIRAPVLGLTFGAASLILAGQAGVIAGLARMPGSAT
jgi:hypothetical protein